MRDAWHPLEQTDPIRGGRVLVVEDSAPQAAYVAALLTSAEFEPVVAESLTEALEHIGADPFDCVLVDLGLPDAEGAEVIHSLSAASDVTTALVVLSADASRGTLLDTLKAGADDYLLKGELTATTLETAILHAIERRSLSRQVDDALTASLRAMSDLQDEQNVSDAILRALQEPVLFLRDDRVARVNPAALEMLGFTAQELVGHGLPLPYWPEEHLDEIFAVRAELLAAGGGTAELTFCRKDGSRFPAELTVAPVPDSRSDVSGVVVTLRDLTAAKEHEAKLEALARTDALTGCRNRRAFDEDLVVTLARSRRSGEPITLLLFDLDDFKALNDSGGHAAGDAVLRECAEAWQGQLRASDLLARLGGDEFAVILNDCGGHCAHDVIARLRDATPHLGGSSVGAATWDGAMTADELVAAADRALYADKARRHEERVPDSGRIAAVRATGRAQSVADAELDGLAAEVSALLGSAAAVTLVDDDRQHLPGLHGAAAELQASRTLPLEASICRYSVASGAPLVVDDARVHPLLEDNVLVRDGAVGAYAGVPMTTEDGHVLGNLCAFDAQPRRWSRDDVALLSSYARSAAQMLAPERDAAAS